jgi:PPP family 3-phenylpropionic acid transporter
MTPRLQSTSPQALVAPRLGFFYFAAFAVVGVNLPFWPVWLESRGLGPTEIGLVLSAGVWIKVVSNPAIAMLADRWGERKRPMIGLSLLALGATALFIWAEGFWALFAVTALATMCFSGLMPLGENLTLITVYERKLDYGRLRLWGSISFIIAATGGGWLLTGRSPALILWLVLGTLACTVLACATLPNARPPAAGRRAAPLTHLLSQPLFLLFLLSAGLIQSSHAVLYGFGTLHWRGLGYGDGLIGGLWAEGVVAEIALFAVSNAVMRRAGLGPAGLIVVAGVLGAVRWVVTGISDALEVLVLVQLLHAATFGLTHLAAMHFIARAVPPEFSATAQSLYSAVAMGVIFGLAMPLSGALYAAFGGGAFHVMAAMCALGSVAGVLLARRWNGAVLPQVGRIGIGGHRR